MLIVICFCLYADCALQKEISYNDTDEIFQVEPRSWLASLFPDTTKWLVGAWDNTVNNVVGVYSKVASKCKDQGDPGSSHYFYINNNTI